jgi:hypothetical protein
MPGMTQTNLMVWGDITAIPMSAPIHAITLCSLCEPFLGSQWKDSDFT